MEKSDVNHSRHQSHKVNWDEKDCETILYFFHVESFLAYLRDASLA